MSSKSTEAYVPVFKTETLPDDFTNVLGAMLLMGWSYTVEHSVVNEVVARITVRAHKVKADGSPEGKAREIQLVWEHVGGEWFCIAEQTGYLKKKIGADGAAIDFKSSDLLINYLGNHTAEWMFNPIEAPKPKRKSRQKAI
ncbi:hypothetical protein, partial [Streptomyces sp. NPDC017890]